MFAMHKTFCDFCEFFLHKYNTLCAWILLNIVLYKPRSTVIKMWTHKSILEPMVWISTKLTDKRKEQYHGFKRVTENLT
jgi:hypothetical protein